MSIVTGTKYAEKEIKTALKANKKALDREDFKFSEEFESTLADEIM